MKLYTVYLRETWRDVEGGRDLVSREVVAVPVEDSDEWLDGVDHESETIEALVVGVRRPTIIEALHI